MTALPAFPDLSALKLSALDFSAAHYTHIQLRFSDTDQMGHINNAAYAVYLESSRLALTASVNLTSLKVVLARLELDYRREVKLGQQVEIQTVVTRFGSSSWAYASRLLADGEVALEARSVQVQVESDMRPVPLSPATKAALATYFAAELSLTVSSPTVSVSGRP
ncbi:acyl-CoA thioesterase [Deinococcus psychrotolerans]|uniref:Acyl-CoA thioesterase n=2 Tax=Deinococcus TaxID=1298 RepID=A0A553V5L7_9DEIO|nr:MULTISPECIES: thioesterase family protein [Deinococcus]AZI42988.1 acyl-CoA thioesterase [Deinococcus psychrotolerans]TSA87767.1 acyl-CoA thioesterase [Deinococcus detaillensis]